MITVEIDRFQTRNPLGKFTSQLDQNNNGHDKAYYWSRTPETRDAFRNMMSETTAQPEDIEINNAHENAFFQEYMLGGNWRGPRKMDGLARCVRYPE